jgi:phage terminase large subunit GpA-like protein
VPGEDKPIAGTPNRKKTGKSKRAVDLYPIGVDQAKSTLYRRFKVNEPGKPGYCHFPKTRDEDYFRQVTAESVVTSYVKGFPRRTWTLPSGQRNEALDCRVYAMGAIAVVRPPWDRFISQRDAHKPKIPGIHPVGPLVSAGEMIVESMDAVRADPNTEVTALNQGQENDETAAQHPIQPAPIRRKRRSNFVNTW